MNYSKSDKDCYAHIKCIVLCCTLYIDNNPYCRNQSDLYAVKISVKLTPKGEAAQLNTFLAFIVPNVVFTVVTVGGSSVFANRECYDESAHLLAFSIGFIFYTVYSSCSLHHSQHFSAMSRTSDPSISSSALYNWLTLFF